MSKPKILFQMTGSIAAFKACAVISKLVQKGFDVKVVASHSALKFIGAATLEGLTNQPIHSDTFENGQMMDHIHLQRWADLVIVCPASANFINKIASGVGDDLLTTLFLAHDFKKPYLLAPAMNTAMYLHPMTQKSLKTLRETGVQILETESGVLACGETGYGRLLEPELIVTKVESELKNDSFKPAVKVAANKALRVLITGGGTREPIDAVRYIGNVSTGQTAGKIAEHFDTLGADVTYLRGQESYAPQIEKTISFSSYVDLKEKLFSLVSTQEFDAVICAAAVSDFSLAQVEGAEIKGQKISSNNEITLKLQKNPKLIDKIKDLSKNKSVKLVGFKLTAGSSTDQKKQSVDTLFEQSHSDVVVQNDVSTLNNRSEHTFYIHQKQGLSSQAKGASDLGQSLFEYLSGGAL